MNAKAIIDGMAKSSKTRAARRAVQEKVKCTFAKTLTLWKSGIKGKCVLIGALGLIVVLACSIGSTGTSAKKTKGLLDC